MGSPDVTALLEAANRGDAAALKAAFAHVYGELKQLARRQLASSATSTLDTTALRQAEQELRQAEVEERPGTPQD